MYTSLAYIYDKLMYDVDYAQWADYIEKIFIMNNLKPELVLDLGCGTGSCTMEMGLRGYEMIGLDISEDMLSCAKIKALEKGLDILYLKQDMRNFELYGTVDAVLCLMDSINYITRKNDIKRMLKLVNNYLNPDGLFIFDINTFYKLRDILGDNIFYDINDEETYIWKNYFDHRRQICEFDLTFFVRDGDLFRKYDEVHYERAYALKDIKELIKICGFKLVAVYDGLNFSKPHAKSERVFFVCKKERVKG